MKVLAVSDLRFHTVKAHSQIGGMACIGCRRVVIDCVIYVDAELVL